jgi:hypothetical protein
VLLLRAASLCDPVRPADNAGGGLATGMLQHHIADPGEGPVLPGSFAIAIGSWLGAGQKESAFPPRPQVTMSPSFHFLVLSLA